jgi:hypothetical protein
MPPAKTPDAAPQKSEEKKPGRVALAFRVLGEPRASPPHIALLGMTQASDDQPRNHGKNPEALAAARSAFTRMPRHVAPGPGLSAEPTRYSPKLRPDGMPLLVGPRMATKKRSAGKRDTVRTKSATFYAKRTAQGGSRKWTRRAGR